MIDLFIKHAPTIGTLFFFFTFCYVIFSVFKKDTKQKFDNYSKIPLGETENSVKEEKNKQSLTK